MADKRIQQYPEKVAPSTSDYLLVADAEDVDVNGYLKYKKVKISSLDNIVITNAEDITLTAINTLISTNALVIGRFYRITNSASGVNPILVQAVALNVLSDIGISSVNGTVYNYDISTDTVSVPYAGVYVPYTGATTNVDLGEYQIKVGQIELDQTPTGTFGVGKIRWNDTDGTPEVMLKGANVTLQIGQEQLARVVNKTNTNLTEAGYQVVRISGAQGQRLKVGLAQANSTSTCKDTLGLVTENISNNAEGFITTSGLVRNINTTGSLQGETWADGDRLYLSPSVAGGITNVEPSAPNIVIVLGYVVYAHASQGSIYVSVEGAKALHELFDVSIPTPTNNNVLVYESSTGLWKDKSISTILGFTPIANNATVGGELSGTLPNPSLVTSAVTGKALTGLSVSGSAVVSTDTILQGIGKLQNQINAVLGSVNFQGVWNASTNSPSLASGVGTKGYYYIVSVAGSTNLDGITDWKLGDWAIYDGTAWQKVDNTDAVVSVNGYTGIVTLAAADVGALPTSAISGTTGKLAKFTSSGAIGDSLLSESSSTVIGDGANMRMKATSYGNNGLFESYGTDNQLKFQAGGNSNTNAYLYAHTGVNLEIYAGGSSRAIYTSDGQYITNGATDTGESHIFGGSVRANGNVEFNAGTSTLLRVRSTAQILDITASASNITFDNIAGDPMLFSIGSSTKINVSATEIITFGALDTGEAHIFGGSARINGSLLTTGSISTTTSNINVGNGTAVENLLVVDALTYSGVRFARGGVNKWAMFNNNAGSNFFDIYNYDTATTSLSISPTNQIITNVASNTGEHFIIGGSARVNGTFLSEGSATILSSSSSTAGLVVRGGSSIGTPSVASGQIFVGATATYRLSMAYDDNIGYAYIDNLYDNANSNIYFRARTSGTPINTLTILGTGNVGIGITSPAYKLSINGNAGIEASEEYFYFHSDYAVGSNARGKIRAVGAGGGSGFGGDLRFSSRASNNAWNEDVLVINSSGNVLIGTTTDDGVNKLQVNGSVAVIGKQTISATSNSAWGLIVDNQGTTDAHGLYVNIGASSSGIPFRVDKNGSALFTIANTGAATFSSSVGVGANPTNAKLEVVATTGEVFRADAAGGAYRIVADQSGVNLQGNINLGTLPTSSAGLSTGDVWNDGGTLKIV